MHAVKIGSRKVALVALTLAAMSIPTYSYAGGGHGKSGKNETNVTGTFRNGQVGAGAYQKTRVQTEVDGNPSSSRTGSLSPTSTNWKPPACWYEPRFSPKELKSFIQRVEKTKFLNVGPMFADMFKSLFQTDKYDNYNMAKQGKGMFWVAVVNEKRKDEPEALSCRKPPFWVDKGETPKDPLAVSPRILAEYAYDQLPVPDTSITMSPDGKQTVNLDTWIWLNRAKFKPVSVTASLPNTNLSATTTATPVALTLEPGTKNAELHPASGECPISNDGSIGTPYSADKKNQTPPCGITYLRSTNNTGPHHLKATLTWKISWTSTNSQRDTLPDGTFGTTTDVTVQEVQAINR